MPEVLNMYTAETVRKANATYIGRGSKWGNPFIIGTHGDRDRVIELYESMMTKDLPMVGKIKAELKGKDLLCFCAPKACHGDVLMRIANEEDQLAQSE